MTLCTRRDTHFLHCAIASQRINALCGNTETGCIAPVYTLEKIDRKIYSSREFNVLVQPPYTPLLSYFSITHTLAYRRKNPPRINQTAWHGESTRLMHACPRKNLFIEPIEKFQAHFIRSPCMAIPMGHFTPESHTFVQLDSTRIQFDWNLWFFSSAHAFHSNKFPRLGIKFISLPI